MTACPHPDDPNRDSDAGQAMDTDDVGLLYQLFLGRAPEAGVALWQSLGRRLADLAGGFIHSAEFSARIHRIEQTIAFPADTEPNGVPVAFLQRFVTLDPLRPDPVGPAALLGSALGSPELWPAFSRVFGERAAGIVSMLADPARHATADEWLGYIDRADPFEISGWVMHTGDAVPVSLAILINGEMIARAEASVFRQDVVDARGVRANCGFNIRPAIPPGLLRAPNLLVSLFDLRRRVPIPLARSFEVAPASSPAPAISLEAELQALAAQVTSLGERIMAMSRQAPTSEYDRFRRLSAVPPLTPPRMAPMLDARPTFSLILPFAAGQQGSAVATIDSVTAQSSQEWELVVVAARPLDDTRRHHPGERYRDDARIRWIGAEAVEGEAAAFRDGAAAAIGRYLVFLRAGCELDPQTLAWFAHAAGNHGARLAYADDYRSSALGATERLFSMPRLKPAFDHDLLLQSGYIGGSFCIEAALAAALGGVREEAGPEALLDLVLRASEQLRASEILHLPLPLFQLGEPGPKAPTPREVTEGQRRAVLGHLARLGVPGQPMASESCATPAPRLHDDWLRWPLPHSRQRLTIVIATLDRRDLLEPCIDSIRRNLVAPGATQILVVDTGTTDPAACAYLDVLAQAPDVRVMPFAGPFNWSRANNLAAADCDDELLLFLNNDIEILTPGFDDVLRRYLARPEVGVVGCLLLYPDGSIQHAGTAIGTGGVAAHVAVGAAPSDREHPAMLRWTRRVGAVTGAFMAMRRDVFRAVDGFDETELGITLNDVDICLKVAQRGLAVLHTPTVACLHHESATRGHDELDPAKTSRAQAERSAFRRRWGETLRFDLWHNPGYSASAEPYTRLVMPSAAAVEAYLLRQVMQA